MEHINYKLALVEAQALADLTGQPVAIRRAREFGREVFLTSLASVNDSDYDRAEIIRAKKILDTL